MSDVAEFLAAVRRRALDGTLRPEPSLAARADEALVALEGALADEREACARTVEDGRPLPDISAAELEHRVFRGELLPGGITVEVTRSDAATAIRSRVPGSPAPPRERLAWRKHGGGGAEGGYASGRGHGLEIFVHPNLAVGGGSYSILVENLCVSVVLKEVQGIRHGLSGRHFLGHGGLDSVIEFAEWLVPMFLARRAAAVSPSPSGTGRVVL